MRINTIRYVTVTFSAIGIAALVVGTIVWQLPIDDLSLRKIRSWEPDASKSKSVLSSSPDEIKVGQTTALANPVFRRSRKPFDPSDLVQPPVTQPPAAAPLPVPQIIVQPEPPAIPPPQPIQTAESLQLSLRGIYAFNGERKALIVNPTQPLGAWLPVGAEINDWTITKVEPNIVTLSLGEQTIQLKLYVDNPSN